MSRPLVLRGALRDGGPIELLRELEGKRITGELKFASSDVEGSIMLYGGAIAEEQPPRGDGRDPVDVFLELHDGTYEVHPRLPPLPVSKGDDFVRTGSLAVHVPADLMTYCERAGLTGSLELRHGERRAEAIYDAGELLAIELDGRGDADLSEVFAWTQGSFRIELDPSAPARLRTDEARPATDDTGRPQRDDTRQFLRVVEMALVDVLDESERARSPTRTSPPLPPPPKARPRPDAVPPPPPSRRAEPTVRLIYLGGDPPSDLPDPSPRDAAKENATEIDLAEARPERSASAEEPEPMTKESDDHARPAADNDEGAGDEGAPPAVGESQPRPRQPEAVARDADVQGSPVAALGWACALVLLGLVILAILARLPPVQ
jgi:hypothetical protein